MLPEHRRLCNVGTFASMNSRRMAVAVLASLSASVLAAVAMAAVVGGPAAANHNQDGDEMWVTVAINAAGPDRISVTDENFVPDRDWTDVAAHAAVAIGQPEGSFDAFEDYDSAYAELEAKLTRTDDRGALSWAFDTGALQLLAQQEGYDALLFEICTPRVKQVYNTVMSPPPSRWDSAGSRCRGWFQPVEESPFRGTVELSPDRNRYPAAVVRAAAAAATTLVVLGLATLLLRRGPLKRRSIGSWLIALGSAFGVSAFGWGLVAFSLWWTGATHDPVMLGQGSVGEQVARAMLPGLIFLVPALAPALILLTAPRKEKAAPTSPPAGPRQGMWWPPPGTWPHGGGSWQTAPLGGPWGPAPVPPGPPPYGTPAPPAWAPPPVFGAPPGPPPTGPPTGEPPPSTPSGWALPGSPNG